MRHVAGYARSTPLEHFLGELSYLKIGLIFYCLQTLAHSQKRLEFLECTRIESR